jgi:thiamine biosynthesis lipoprotein
VRSIPGAVSLALALAAWSVAAPSPRTSARAHPSVGHHVASRISMACEYAIEAYGPDAAALPRIVDEALDEVDRLDRLMSHYKSDSPVSRVNREAAQHPVTIDRELFDFLAAAMRYSHESHGAFDITVGPLIKAWGFFGGEGRVPSETELAAARRLVGGAHVTLNPASLTVAFDAAGVELDLGGIAKGYAVDRVVALLKQRQIAAALVSAGGSTIYALGAPPGHDGWPVTIQDPLDSRKVALTLELKDRALSVAGRSEKSFASGGTIYSHIMDPRTGMPAQGVLSVVVLARTGTEGDALDDAFFVLGAEGSREYLNRLHETEALFFLPDRQRGWTIIRPRVRRSTGALKVDHRIGRQSRKRELGRTAGDNAILKRERADAGDARVTTGISAAQADAQPLDLAAAVVEQVQPRAAGSGRQPADHDLAAVDAQRPPVVGELTTDLERERARIGGLLARVLGSADPDVESMSR